MYSESRSKGGDDSDMNDADLIRQCQRGDGAAFRRLYERHVHLALRTAYGVLRDRELAQDAVQEAFVRAFGNIATVDPERPFSSWLTRIVINESIRLAQWRRKGGEPTADDLNQISPANTEHEVTQSERRLILQDCVAVLPAELSALIVLKYFRELTDPEIAQTMECPIGTVKSRLARARTLLRETCRLRGLSLTLDEA
jgi:RNA polymerase sigma-70 factor, ECF subfamily